jgi:uncharacterized protein YjiS (DUF1127 family)
MTFLIAEAASSAGSADPAIDVRDSCRPTSSTIPGSIAAASADLALAYRRRRDHRHLGTLPDHLLKDIGISRGEIDAAVAGLTRREVNRVLERC